jgi:signal transduction histidine kinase
MVLAFSIAGALHGALGLWRDNEFPQGQRMVIGLGLLLGIRFILFIVAGFSTQGTLTSHALLPLIDRAATSMSVIVIIWMWIFPEPMRLADFTSGLLGFLTLIEVALSWVWWRENNADFAFNATRLNLGWEVYALALLILGAIYLAMRRPNGWGYGISMLVISTLGHLAHLIWPLAESDFPGAVRLAQMAAYPLLLTLPRRFNIPVITPEEAITTPAPSPTTKSTLLQDRPRYGIEPKSFQALIAMMGETSEPKLYKSITRAVAETMLADICLLLKPPSNGGNFTIECGYDLIREITLESIVLEQDQLPLLDTAMQKSRPLRLPSSSTSRDLLSISHILSLGNTGHLLASFVPSQQGSPQFGIVLLSPHSDRRWSREDQQYLEDITQTLAPILQRSKLLETAHKQYDESQQNVQSLQALLADSQAENDALRADYEEMQSALKKDNVNASNEQQIEELLNLRTEYRKAQDTIARVQVENQRLSEMVENLLPENTEQERDKQRQLAEELDLALHEISHLKEQLSRAEQKMQELATAKQANTLSDDQTEVFASIAQDLRQPMSSITGYTGLLLDESAGILGALQRKFLERIRASITRMETLIDELIQITMLDSEQMEITPEDVDLGSVIDKAIADTRSQLQEKDIILRVDLPQVLPRIHADRDALQQILIHLLKNAGTISPTEGEIYLSASIPKTEDVEEYVLIKVADQGGGIPKDDLPRVFSRLYRADNPLIEGVGDTGVGLSIVKTLVEALNGRAWVDTEMGVGSTFSVIFPLTDQNVGGLS